MTGRPSRFVIGLEVAALVAAVALGIYRAVSGHGNWELDVLLFLLALSIIADILVVQTAASGVKTSGSFLAIITAIVFLGPTPAALIGLATILTGWAVSRYDWRDLLTNLVTYAWFPLLAGIAFQEAVDRTGATETDPLYYVLIFGLFTFALAINFAIIAGYSAYVDRSSVWTKVRRALGPVLPTELASALLAVGIARAYVDLGLPALALFGVGLLTFQYLLGALLLSQERGEELELRARQLAGFQVAVLTALLRTLDLRDRMTARHSAAVARYAREIAAAAGLSEEDQELAHTAGLLHDIGKFILSDRILKGDEKLTEEDWERDPPPSLRGLADRVRDRRLPADRRHHPRPPRAHRRPRLPARAPGRRDPRDLAHHLGRRHLRRDDGARLLPRAGQLARGDRGAAPRLGHPARRATSSRSSSRCSRSTT